MDTDTITKHIEAHIEKGLPKGFSGMGIILVDNESSDLPVSSLLSSNYDLSKYNNDKEIIGFLFEISHVKDIRHDGFHIVDTNNGLLCISQYFGPVIPATDVKTVYDVGARYRTAQYGSLCKGVVAIIIVSQAGIISIAQKGCMETLEK
jgi:hypothetical protein